FSSVSALSVRFPRRPCHRTTRASATVRAGGWRLASGDGACELLAGALADGIGDGGDLPEAQLQRAQSVADRPRVHVADLGGSRGHETGERIDELARLIEVGEALRVGILAEPELDGGR